MWSIHRARGDLEGCGAGPLRLREDLQLPFFNTY
jgi:hypothetical protein